MNVHDGRRIRWFVWGAGALAVTAVAAAVGQSPAVHAQPVPVRFVATSAKASSSGAVMRPAAVPPTSPISHVVVLYLENHSFDNVLGYWCNASPGRCPDGGMPSSVTLSNGTVVSPGVTPDVVPNVSHSVAAQQAAINGGSMNGWQRVPGCGPRQQYRCISGYEPAQVPNVASLADHFAISDATFSMANSPSWGGHLDAVMGSLDGFTGDNPKPVKNVQPGFGWGCNSGKVTPWSRFGNGQTHLEPSCIPDPSLGMRFGGAFEATQVPFIPSIMDRLDNAGLPWRIYGQPTPADGLGYIWDTCPSIAECLYTSQNNNNVPATRFINDAQTGNLAAFSLLTPGGQDSKNSEHNGFSMTAGDNWVGRVASAIMNGPDWNSTALFITWDDCGCFYDHVSPGVNPDGTPQGPRSPLLIVSPFARPGFTDNTPATYVSILAFVERNFGLKPLSVNDAHAYPFSDAFNFGQAPLRPAHMVSRPVPKGEHIKYWQARQDT